MFKLQHRPLHTPAVYNGMQDRCSCFCCLSSSAIYSTTVTVKAPHPPFSGTPSVPTAHENLTVLSGLNSRPSGPRLPKMPQLQDFQFFQVDRLNEIYEKEQAYELHKHTNNQKEAAARAQVCLVF